MDLIELLTAAQGGKAAQSIGSQFGLDAAQSATAMEVLAPVIGAGLRRNIAKDGGYDALIDALSNGKHENYYDDPRATEFENVAEDGNQILGHIFGSKQVSRDVANFAAGETGIGAAILKKMLPIIASIILGSLTKGMRGGAPQPQPQSGGGGLGDILGDILGGGGRGRAPQPRQQQGPGGFGDILKDILGGGSAGGGGRGPAGYNPEEKPDMSLDLDDTVFRQDPQKGRDMLDDFLGRGTTGGSVADDLLNSVEQAIRSR